MSESASLLVIFLFIVVFIIIFTSKVRLHPFIVLLISSMAGGVLAGMPLTKTVVVISEGFGSTLKNIGIVIALGSIIGYILKKSGGALKMADTLLRITGEKRSPLAMSWTGFLVSILVFCDSGFIVLSSLNRALSRKSKIPLSVFAVALSTGLYSSHNFVPPAAGPLAATSNLGADVGFVIILGIIVAIPSVMAGYFWAVKYASRFKIAVREEEFRDEKEDTKKLPGSLRSFMPILIPLSLIGLRSLANFPSYPFGSGVTLTFFNFIGNPIIALMVGVFLTFFLVQKLSKEVIHDWIGEGLKNAGVIILITGAGGSLGAILKETGIGVVFGEFLSRYHLGIFLPFLIAAALKTAQGSSTVAIITTSALMAPMLSGLGFDSSLGRTLVVLAVGAGSMTVSHANDSYFWVVSQFSDMDVSTAYKCQTLGTLIVGLTGIATVAVVSLILL
ncbi:GntP family permease [candidate division KSB1 bacterium]